MIYLMMYLVAAALCITWVYSTVKGMTMREMLIDEIEKLDEISKMQHVKRYGNDDDFSSVDPEKFVDVCIIGICVIAWPVFILLMLKR